jgi:general secretion pathway protein I
MVSIVILSVGIVLILELFSSGLRFIRVGEDYNTAVLHAKDKMEEILLDNELKEGEYSGSFDDGYNWESRVSIFDKEETKFLPFMIYKIYVKVLWKNRYYELITLKMVKKRRIY